MKTKARYAQSEANRECVKCRAIVHGIETVFGKFIAYSSIHNIHGGERKEGYVCGNCGLKESITQKVRKTF